MNFPKEIEDCYLELAATDEQIRRRRLEVRSLEIDITVDATTKKDEAGKLLLTNDLQRKAAVEKLLSETAEYAEYAETLSNLEQDRIKLTARLERLRLELKLHILECEQNNAIAALKVADAIWHARRAAAKGENADGADSEFTLPF